MKTSLMMSQVTVEFVSDVSETVSPLTPDNENIPSLWNMGHQLHVDTADCFTLHYVLSPQKLQIMFIMGEWILLHSNNE
jgi:hypothetical protein